MIVVRDIFRLKFGQAKEATELWKKAAATLQQSGYGVKSTRLLTDVAGGSYYTIVLETSFDSLADWEKAHQQAKLNTSWREVHAKVIPLTAEGRREVLSVIA